MVDEKTCYKKFKKIRDRKEKEGYDEWKSWVLAQIKDYDEKQLVNLEKRTKLN